MEKYRQFADPQTGLNLFVPIFANHKTTILERLYHIIFGLIYILIRLPILLILFLLAILLNTIQLHSVNQMNFRLILLVLGFYSIDYQVPLQEQPGSVILCNNSSPIDWLFHLYYSYPQFTQMYDDEEKITFRTLSFGQVLQKLFTINKAQIGQAQYTLPEVLSQKKPTVIFFEGTQTNQIGVLAPPQDLVRQLQAIKPQVYIYIITYPDQSLFTPINTTRNGFWHFLILLTNFSNQIHIISQDFESHSDYGKLMKNIYDSEGFRMVNQSWKTGESFLSYYHKTKKGNYVKED